jgi:tetraacyldisaccharide 4'-kinase
MKNLLLTPLSKIFEVISQTRFKLYKNNILKTKTLNCKTISVGNITVGGTGKTPLVAFIAEFLANNGEKVCVLTRGYGRENPNKRVLVSDGKTIFSNAKESGDEPFELAEKLLGKAAVISDKKRFDAGKWANKNLGITAFILDDGFQHIQLKRDLDIICIDATNPFGNHKLLPKGALRESLDSLRRADVIVITRVNLVESSYLVQQLIVEIQNFTDAPIFVSRNKIIHNSEFININCFAFCGLGNPHNFFNQLKQDGIEASGTKIFRDHYKYLQDDVVEIERLAKNCGAKMLLTTAKDGVKLKNLEFSMPIEIVESKLVFDNEEAFKECLEINL